MKRFGQQAKRLVKTNPKLIDTRSFSSVLGVQEMDRYREDKRIEETERRFGYGRENSEERRVRGDPPARDEYQKRRDLGSMDYYGREEEFQGGRSKEGRLRGDSPEREHDERRGFNKDPYRSGTSRMLEEWYDRKEQKRKDAYVEERMKRMEEGEMFAERGYKRPQSMKEERFPERDEREMRDKARRTMNDKNR